MALKMQSTQPKTYAAHVEALTAAGFDVQALIVWAEKYGEEEFIPIALALISGNYAAAIAVALKYGPQSVLDLVTAVFGATLPAWLLVILQALGISISTPSPAGP